MPSGQEKCQKVKRLTSDGEATSDWVVQKGLLETETFKWDVKGKKGSGMRKLGGRAFQTQRRAGAKALSGKKPGKKTRPGELAHNEQQRVVWNET